MSHQVAHEDSDAAAALLQLYTNLRGRGHIIPDEFGCDPQELTIFAKHYSHPLPRELIDFLSKTSPRGYLDIGVFKTDRPEELLKQQLDAVPLEGNIKYGFFGLGWWTGETDGDGWLYDLVEHRIYAVQIYSNDEANRESVIDTAYQRFDSLKDWVSFLEKECRQRGWID
jgi:hypothetical protein